MTMRPGLSLRVLLRTAGTRRKPSTPTIIRTSMPPGATSRRWCGATARVSVVRLADVTALSTGQAASTAVSGLERYAAMQLLTDADYSFFGNNIAAGQFEAQVWAPVCHDPAAGEVVARQDVNFDWAGA